ncbi:FAD:protein FMN transferase [Ideonella sp.]|uniref:FAD:protein FMN transferase n=1 Tax=Ideonella sp. TaxID=1929293 RepID=UPI002B4973CC|nr:FAD:protein FMN transferase [Ideonella sp.]HJV68411.1 FAD:protein FMN transferase [Ideonella sp.]
MAGPNAARRHLLGALACGSAVGWLAAPARAGAAPALRDSRVLMGTRVDIALDGAATASLQQALDCAWAEMQRLADMMSRYVPGNPLDALNRAAGHRPIPIPLEMMGVLKSARRISRRTEGAFDPTVGSLAGWDFGSDARHIPDGQEIRRELRFVNFRRLILDETAGTAFLQRAGTRLDLGGVAKLPILRAGLDVLERAGVPAAMVNGGGDVLVGGGGPDRAWRIGVRDPATPERLLAVLPLTRGIVASSGDYERGWSQGGRRFHHVLDPATGYPTEGVHGVTLVGEHVDDVNGLGTAAMVMGPGRGVALLAATPQRQALLVGRDGQVWVSPALSARLEPAPGEPSLQTRMIRNTMQPT